MVGIVGGGGIGATLNTAFDRYEFDSAAAILLVIIAIVMAAEYTSGFIRKRVAVVPVTRRNGTKVWHRRTTRMQLLIWGGWLACVAVFVACWQLISEKTIWMFVTDSPRQAADLGERMIPPKLSYMSHLWLAIWDTINIATLGTLLAIILAIPTAYCAARNTTPSRAFVRPVALFIIVASRSINSLIWALMLVTIVGPGVFAGIIAIGLRSIGFCGKLLYEAIEEIDHTQVEAVTATGAAKAAGRGLRHRAPGAAGVRGHLRVSAGTSTSANPRCSAWSAPAASDCSSTPRS